MPIVSTWLSVSSNPAHACKAGRLISIVDSHRSCHYAGDDFILVGARKLGGFLYVHRVVGAVSVDYGDVVFGNAGNVGYVSHALVHAQDAYQRTLNSADGNVPLVAHVSRISVRISERQRGYYGVFRSFPAVVIAYSFSFRNPVKL